MKIEKIKPMPEPLKVEVHKAEDEWAKIMNERAKYLPEKITVEGDIVTVKFFEGDACEVKIDTSTGTYLDIMDCYCAAVVGKMYEGNMEAVEHRIREVTVIPDGWKVVDEC